MKEVPLDECKWCNGSGDDGGGYGQCPDCQSTGFEYGKAAEVYFEHVLNEQEKELTKRGLL